MISRNFHHTILVWLAELWWARARSCISYMSRYGDAENLWQWLMLLCFGWKSRILIWVNNCFINMCVCVYWSIPSHILFSQVPISFFPSFQHRGCENKSTRFWETGGFARPPTLALQREFFLFGDNLCSSRDYKLWLTLYLFLHRRHHQQTRNLSFLLALGGR